MSLSLSKRWAENLAQRTGQSRENEAVLAFVIEVFIINLLNITLIITLGFLFDVLPETITCMVTIALLRFTAGGAHSNNPWRCAAVTAFVFSAIALTASHLATVNLFYIDVLSVLALICCFTAVIHFAPVDSPAAPILSVKRRKRLKFMSLLVAILIAITVIILRRSTWIHAGEIQAAMILCILWGSFNLTGPGHRLMNLIDGFFVILSKRQGGELCEKDN